MVRNLRGPIFDPEPLAAGFREEVMAVHWKSFGFRLVALLVICCSAGLPPRAAPAGCDAEIAAELTSKGEVDDGIRLEFEIAMTSKETCTDTTYDLILIELLPNGQWKSVRKTRRLEMRSGSAIDVVQHVMASDLTLLEYEARVVECHPCENP